MPKITLAGIFDVSLRSFFGHVNIRTRHNFSEMVSLMLFTEIISVQHSHFIFAVCAAKDYSNLLGWGISGSSNTRNCLPGPFHLVLSHWFPGCIPPYTHPLGVTPITCSKTFAFSCGHTKMNFQRFPLQPEEPACKTSLCPWLLATNLVFIFTANFICSLGFFFFFL